MDSEFQPPGASDLIFYRAPDGAVSAEVRYEGETFWLSQRQMAEQAGNYSKTSSSSNGRRS